MIGNHAERHLGREMIFFWNLFAFFCKASRKPISCCLGVVDNLLEGNSTVSARAVSLIGCALAPCIP
jgi:hypothetical protein